MSRASRPLRVVRYLRVSRSEQTVAMQDDETKALVERRGWKLVDSYEDVGVTGRASGVQRWIGCSGMRAVAASTWWWCGERTGSFGA